MNFEQREKQKRLTQLDARLESNPLDGRARAEWIAAQEQRLYVVEFESMNYAGAPSHCLVWALDEEDAKMSSEEYAENFYWEEDGEQYIEENGDDDQGVIWSTTKSAVLLEGSEFAKYVEDERQQQAYYEIVN